MSSAVDLSAEAVAERAEAMLAAMRERKRQIEAQLDVLIAAIRVARQPWIFAPSPGELASLYVRLVRIEREQAAKPQEPISRSRRPERRPATGRPGARGRRSRRGR